MHYVYLLRSIGHPDKTYIGLTSDLRSRLQKHNEGGSPHTAKFAPWKLQCCFAFETENLARNFERYLKSGSGRAFAKRHFEESSPPGVSDSGS